MWWKASAARRRPQASSYSSTPMCIPPGTSTSWYMKSRVAGFHRAASLWPSAAWWTTSSTIINVAKALDSQPVVDKYLTVTGAVHKPLTTVVPVGTSLQECLQLAGGCTVDDPVILTGGLMMGGVASGIADPVAKNMGGVIALPSRSLPGAAQDCGEGNLHADWPWPMRSMLAVHRVVSAVHHGLSHPAASSHADPVDDRRSESTR